MNLKDFADSGRDPIPLGFLSDAALIADIQGRLMVTGLLDPPVDGRLGPVSMWALRAFCERAKLPLDKGLTGTMAAALLEATADTFFPIRRGADFAGRVVQALMAHGYWIARHPDCRNIVYIEGCDPDGRTNGNKPNVFNDCRVVVSIHKNGAPILHGTWKGTTEPGEYWTIHPMDPNGAARIAFGQYKAWARGTHHAGSVTQHEALVQVAEVTVYRDSNKTRQREGKTYTGLFGINQHCGYDNPEDDLRTSSAGCLVGRTKDGHQQFMTLIKKDPRYVANNGYRFMTTIMPASSEIPSFFTS